MPPGFDPGGFQGFGEFSDAVGLTRETTGFDLGQNLIQRYLNEGGSPGAEYAGIATTGGTVAYDARTHSGAQSLRVVRTSAAAVGALSANLPLQGAGVVHQNGRALQGEFWIYANALPSAATVPIFHAAANSSQNAELWLTSAGQVVARQQQGATGSFSAASATSVTTGQWFKISWMFDISLPDLSTLRFWVNNDSPVTHRWANRYGTQDTDYVTNVSYGCMTTVQPAASTFDICFDDQSVFSIPGFRDGTLQYLGNEANSITIMEYDNTTTTGGTVALVTTQHHDGTTALRINRTSAAAVNAETCGMTISGYVPHQQICGSFWIRVASYPAGVGDTPIFSGFHSVGDNFDITLSNTGKVRCRRQDGNLASAAAQSSYSASTVSLNTWTQIFWSSDGSTGTFVGTVAIGSDPPQAVSWAQAAEIHPWVDFGCKTFAVSSNYDIYYDESYIFEGLIYPIAPVIPPALALGGSNTTTADLTLTSGSVTFPASSSPGTSTATASSLVVRLPFPTTPVLDNFNRANQVLTASPNWHGQMQSSTTNQFSISSNQITTAVGNADAYWVGSVLGDNVEIYVTMGTTTATNAFRLWVRGNNPGTGSFTGYRITYDADQGPSNGYLSIVRGTAGLGGPELAGGYVPTDLGIGDKVGVRVVGNAIEAFYKVGAGAWTRFLLVTDSTYPTGSVVGLWTNEGSTFFDDFGGGIYNTFALPSVSSAGTGSISANNLKIRLPSDLEGGTSTATAQALRLRLPSRSSAGVGTVAQGGLKIRLPVRTSASTCTATATGLRERLGGLSSAGTSTATATALKVRLPSRTSASASTATATAFRVRLGGLTSVGIGSVSANNVKIKLSAQTSAGSSSTSTTNLNVTGGIVTLPARTSSGTSTATAQAPRVQLPGRSSAGTGTSSATALKIRLPSRTSAGVATTTTLLGVRLSARTSAGTGTATATALRIKLPTRTSLGTGSLTQAGLKIRLPSGSSTGTSSLSQVGLKDKLSPLTSAGSSTATAQALKIKLPSRTSAGGSTATAATMGGTINLPARTSAGTSTATAQAFWVKFPARTATGTSTATALLAERLPARSSAGSSTATAQALKIKLPSRTGPGTGTSTATAFKIKLPPITTGVSGAAISLAFDHGFFGSASASTTLDIPTTRAVTAGNYLILTAATSSGTAGILSIAVQSGVDPGDLSWTHYDAAAFGIGAFVAFTRCPTGVNSGVSFRITWSGVAFGTRRATLSEWAGLASSGVEDTHTSATAVAAGDPTVNITTTNAADLVLAGLGHQSATSYTPLNGFTELHDNNGGSRTVGTIYQIESATGTYTPAADAASNNNWAIVAVAFKGGGVPGSSSNAVALPLRVSLPASSAGTSTATAQAFKIRLPSRTVAGTSTAVMAVGGPMNFLSVTSLGLSTATQGGLRVRLPQRSVGGVGTTSAPLGARLPTRASQGTSTATAQGLKIRLPSRAGAGTSTGSAAAFRIRLPNRTSASTSTATAQAFRARFGSRTSVGTSTATATAFKIKLPARTSTGTTFTFASALAGGPVLILGVSTAGHSNATQAGLRIKLPSRSTGGTSTATSAALRSYLVGVTSAGQASTAQGGLRIKLPSRTTLGTSSTAQAGLKDRIGQVTSAGHATSTAQALRIKLPTRLVAGLGSTSVTTLKSGIQARTSAGSSTATAQKFKIQLPARTSSGTSNVTQAGLRDQVALATTAGHATCTVQGLKIKLPGRSTAGTSSTLGKLTQRLPARTAAGHSNATVTFLRPGLHSLSLGIGAATAQAFRIKLPSLHSNGTSDDFARSFLYIPPPPKVVISSGSSHVLTSSTAGHLVVASGPDPTGSVTASTGGAVTPAGDLTKTVTVSR